MTSVNEHHDARAEHSGLRARRRAAYAHADGMAPAALSATSGVGCLCLRQRLHHHRAARRCWPFLREARLSFHRSAQLRISSSFPHWRKPPARAIPSWGTLLDSSAAMLPLRLRWPRARLSACTPASMAQELLAAALSLSATGALMALFRVSHPPAGATTLIVSLGIISQPKELVIIEVAVILLTVQAFAINRLAGIPYPLWRCHKPSPV